MAPKAAPGLGGKTPGSRPLRGHLGGRIHHRGVSSCSSACGGAWNDGCSDASLSSAGRRRARGRWNERRLCTRRAAAERACAPGSPRRSNPAPCVGPASDADPASDIGSAPSSRSGAAAGPGFWAVGWAVDTIAGAGLGRGGANRRGGFSAAGSTSRGDVRPVSGASEPVSPAGEISVIAGS